MNSDNEGFLEKFENELLEDLKKLEVEIPNQYFMKKIWIKEQMVFKSGFLYFFVFCESSNQI